MLFNATWAYLEAAPLSSPVLSAYARRTQSPHMHRILSLQGELKDKYTLVSYGRKVSMHIYIRFVKC